MKLKKYEDKSKKKRKAILISISVVVLISVSFLLYKTFASFTENAEFPMMNGKVDYFGNSDIYFVFYQGDKELEEMPGKDNKENLVFDHGECDNGASIEWNENDWAPLVKGLNKVKTKCSLYFKVEISTQLGGMKVRVVNSGNGLYKVDHDVNEISNSWNNTEYRYAGENPNNYVSFNNEIWRIIGLVNVKTESRIEQRLKIVRTNGVGEQKDFGSYAWDLHTNNWTTSELKNMLNGIYYESGKGDCYTSSSASECDFNSGEEMPKGLDDISRSMIDKEVVWNIGGWNSYNIPAYQFYEKERGINTGSSNTYPSEWSKETDVEEKHNGVGLIYPSDYGYAVGGEVRNNCLGENLSFFSENCNANDWLKPNGSLWTIMPRSSNNYEVNYIGSNGVSSFFINPPYLVWPVVYLSSSVKIIDGNGEIGTPFILEM